MLDLVKQVPFFDNNETKEQFLIIIGALNMRLISLRKASEIINITEDTLLKMINSLGIDFSYLDKDDISIEKEWK